LNSNKIVEAEDFVAARINEVNRIIMEHEGEFTSYDHMVTYGMLNGISHMEMDAFVQICKSVAEDPTIKLGNPKEILYFMLNQI